MLDLYVALNCIGFGFGLFMGIYQVNKEEDTHIIEDWKKWYREYPFGLLLALTFPATIVGYLMLLLGLGVLVLVLVLPFLANEQLKKLTNKEKNNEKTN